MKLIPKLFGYVLSLLALLAMVMLGQLPAKGAVEPRFGLSGGGLTPPSPPTDIIISPVAGSRTTNAIFTFFGHATADVEVTAVYYSLNGSAWAPATLSDAASFSPDWSVAGNLIAGVNVFQTYAVDNYGNQSSVSSVQITAVLSTTLAVQTNGGGTLNHNYNGATLQVGQNYSLTATASAGFAFTNWTGADGTILTNGRTLSFTMASNLVLNANFADVTRPTLSLTAPTAGLEVSNADYAITGRAADNVAVSNVLYSLNGSAWTPAATTNHWATWTADVTLTASNNTLQAYAVDTSGNLSVTSKVSFIYVASAVLSVQTNEPGWGTISPSYDGALLQIGKTYSMTAVAAKGFAFIGWFAQQSSNLPGPNNSNVGTIHFFNYTNNPLVFTMGTGLSILANFANIAPPTLSITTPAANFPATNAAFIITGKASDNVGVSDVLYSLNGSAWTPAASTNNWTNWTVGVNLQLGTNTVQAYAVDASGNLSTTGKVTFSYVVNTPLIVQTNQVGWGGISPNLNKARLALNENYQLTATAAPGFQFTGWTGSFGLATNSRVLTFTMQSNLMLTASFVDTQKPALSISSPLPNQLVAGSSFVIHGTASDNAAVASVWYQFNGGGWQKPVGTNNWSVAVTLNPDTNTVMAYSVDINGNVSPTNTVNFFYVDKAPIKVGISGNGTVSPNYNGASLQIGQNYSMTAKPASGFGLVGWTSLVIGKNEAVSNPASPGSGYFTNVIFLTNNPTLTFAMASNLDLQASFVDITPPTATNTTLFASVTNIADYLFSQTFYGTAHDNVAVSNVWCQLNGGGWEMPSTQNNWTNWSLCCQSPVLGTNLMQVYAVDTSGNVSATNTTSFVFVDKESLTVNMVGRGTISPFGNGTPLQVGQDYTLTATPAPGFVFSNWTALNLIFSSYGSPQALVLETNFVFNGVVTNGSVLSFQMVSPSFYPLEFLGGGEVTSISNAGFQVTFVDIVPPTIAITSPMPGQSVTNMTFIVTGKALDNGGVAAVSYQINGGGWQPASTGNGYTNWFTPSLTLLPGTNTIQAYAVDTSGNVSPTNAVNIFNTLPNTAPASLAGFAGTITSVNGSTSVIGFGSSTFSLTSSDTADEGGNTTSLGGYTYAKLQPDTAQLVITNSTFPGLVESVNFDLTFTSPLMCTYANERTGDSGTISLYHAANLAPASVAGGKALLFQTGGTETALAFGSSMADITGGTSGVQTETYTYQTYSSLAALLTMGDPVQGTNYSVLAWQYTNYGGYFSTVYDAQGNQQNTESGVFAFPTTSPSAPASLAGAIGRLTYGDGTQASLSFGGTPGNATFSLDSVDFQHDSSVGNYTYSRLNGNQARLNRTVTAPPANKNDGGSVLLTFVTPDFCLFTNENSGGGGINTLAFYPVPTLAPASIGGLYLQASGYNGNGGYYSLQDTIAFNKNGTYTKIEYVPYVQTTTTGSYKYTVESPVGALIQLNSSSGAVYMVNTFFQTNSGTFATWVNSNSGAAPTAYSGSFFTSFTNIPVAAPAEDPPFGSTTTSGATSVDDTAIGRGVNAAPLATPAATINP